MSRRQICNAGLPTRTIPVEIVGRALQAEGRAVSVQAHAAAVIGRAAAEAGRHSRGTVSTAVWRSCDRCRDRRRLVQSEAHGTAREGIPHDVGCFRLKVVRTVGLRRPCGHGGVARPGRRRVPRCRAMRRGQIGDTRLPGRTGPVEAVGGALQGEGRAIRVQAHAASVVGRAAAEAGGHRGGKKLASVCRRRDGCRCRCCFIQREGDRGTAKCVPGLVRGCGAHSVDAVRLRGPGRHCGAAGPCGRRVSGGRAVGRREIGNTRLPDRAGPVVVVGGALQGKGGAVQVQAYAAAIIGCAAAKSCGNRSRPVDAPIRRTRHGCRHRRRVVQRESNGGTREGIARLIRRGGSYRERAISLRCPRGHRRAARPGRCRVAGRCGVGCGQIGGSGLPG